MNKIFGYDWEDIQRAQQGGRLAKPIDTSRPPELPQVTERDIELLETHGIERLKEMGYFGLLDRLKRNGYNIE